MRTACALLLVLTSGALSAAPDLGTELYQNGVFHPGAPGGRYSITLWNQGSAVSPGTHVGLRQALPEGTAFASASGFGWDCAASSVRELRCSYDTGFRPLAEDGWAPDLDVRLDVTAVPGSRLSLPPPTITLLQAGAGGETAADAAGEPRDVAVRHAPIDGLSIQQTVDRTTPAAGGDITYTVSVRNDGNEDLNGLTLEDLLPRRTAASVMLPTPPFDDANLWQFDLAAGEEKAFTLPARAAADRRPFANTARFAGDAADSSSLVTWNSVGVAVDGVELGVAQSVDTAAPAPGDTLTFTLEVGNQGRADATGVAVSGRLPPELAYRGPARVFPALSDHTPVVADGSVSWPDLTLAAGQKVRIDIPAQVVGGEGERLFSRAAVASDTANEVFDPDLRDNVATAVVAVGGTDLELLAELSDDVPTPGDQGQLLITARNLGPRAIDRVWLDLRLPPSGAVSVAADGLPEGPAPVTVALPADGRKVTLLSVPYSVSPDAPAGERLTFSARVTQALAAVNGEWRPLADPDESNNGGSVRAVVGGADLAVSLDAEDATPAPGGTFGYSVRVENLSPRAASGVSLKFYPPRGVSFGPAEGDGDYAGGTWRIDTLGAGDYALLRIPATVQAAPGSRIVARATALRADQGDPDRGNNRAQAEVVVGGADLELSWQVAPGPYAPGEPIAYTLKLRNLSPHPVASVAVRNLPPPALDLTQTGTNGGRYRPGEGTWELPRGLAPFGEPGFTAELNLAGVPRWEAAGRTLAMVAEVAARSAPDPRPGNDRAVALISVAPPETTAAPAKQRSMAPALAAQSSESPTPFSLRLRDGTTEYLCSAHSLTIGADGTTSVLTESGCLIGLSDTGSGQLHLDDGSGTGGVRLVLSRLAVNAAGEVTAWLESAASATGCSGDVVELSGYTFGATEVCSATTSLSAGTGTTVTNGQNVEFAAPSVVLLPGFSVEAGATFRARGPAP